MKAGKKENCVPKNADQKMIEQIRAVWTVPARTVQQQVEFDDRLRRRIETECDCRALPKWLAVAGVGGVLVLVLALVMQLSDRADTGTLGIEQTELAVRENPAGWIDWMDAVFEPQDEQILVARLGLEYQALDEVLTTYLVKK